MNLRGIVIGLTALGVLLALGLALTHCPAPWLMLGGYCALGLLAVLVERGRYRPRLTGTSFEPTAERYEDPVTGQRIEVYLDPASGERDYRPNPAS